MQGKANFELGPELPQQHVNLEVDRTRQRQYGHWMMLGFVLLAALVFNMWQRADPVNVGLDEQAIAKERKAQEELARKFELEILSLTSPRAIETFAIRDLHMVAPGPDDIVVLPRVVAAPAPPASVVAMRQQP
jgi:hypothetical protein